ncbi:MAG: YeeE/YedE family protein [Verrucomicrobiota bacterium]|nr:YeeE/YedE family protein [Chthoniobacterales bacterium]MDQ3415411.1 YeeE/YedE family protein [Verrucomicrobiota bacterium]
MRRLFVYLLVLTPSLAMAAEPRVNALNFPGPAWSPYLVGAGIGVLSWLTFYFADKAIGASSFYATVAGALGRLFARRHTDSLDYYKENPPKVGWETVLVLATIAGAFIAAVTGGEFTGRWLPPFWVARFGPDSLALHGVVGFLGGILMAFGARFAGGCTSGHGISGALQLNVGSWISVVCFFIGGIAVAIPLYLL